ncbi:MAG TPA: response regulator transcription factor [Gaiellaceae bacterium]|nr:response regulator transcription factor [Gaiellaceae bacterium]
MSRILVVEDEPAISDAVAYALREAGYDVATVGDGAQALVAAQSRDYDLMVLDLLLPGTPGLEVCRTLREEQSDLPIVMLTARDAELERVEGLDVGADDYVTKPFSVAELVSRVRSLLRRRELDRAAAGAVQTVGGIRLDVSRHSATVDGKPLLLTRSEFKLVALLASEPGRAFSREELIRHLWESEFVGDRRAIDVHVSNLRRKLEHDARNPRRLLTVRGVGYTLVAD